MSWDTVKWIVPLIPLLALVAVLKLKRQVSAEGSASYYQIISGLIILSLVSVAQTYYAQGLLASVPFFSEPVFNDLISWIATITGATFLISGVTRWLPLSRAYRKYNRERVLKLEFVKKVEQLVGVETRLDEVLDKTLEHMLEYYDIRAGAILKYSRTRRRLFLASATDDVELTEGNVYKLAFSEVGWQKYTDGTPAQSAGVISGLGEIVGHPNLLLPMCPQNRPAGFILLWWDRGAEIDHVDELNLRVASDIVSRKIAADELNLKLTATLQQLQWQRRIISAVTGAAELKTRVTLFSQQVRQMAPATVVSLIHAVKGKTTCRRVTVGTSGAPLVEESAPFPSLDSSVGKTLLSADFEGWKETHGAATRLDETAFTTPGVQSGLMVPYGTDSNRYLMLVGGGRRFASEAAMCRLSETIQMVLPMVVGQAARQQTAVEDDRVEIMRQFVDFAGIAPTFSHTCRYAARMLNKYLDIDMVRISMLDDDQRFLTSQALVTNGRTVATVPEQGTLILSLMPRHEQVLQLGQTLVVTDRSGVGPFSEMEAQQVFCPPMRAATLVPIFVNHLPRGIITLAPPLAANRQQFKRDEVQFVETVASVLSMSIRLTAGWNWDRTELEEALERFTRATSMPIKVTTPKRTPQPVSVARTGSRINLQDYDRVDAIPGLTRDRGVTQAVEETVVG